MNETARRIFQRGIQTREVYSLSSPTGGEGRGEEADKSVLCQLTPQFPCGRLTFEKIRPLTPALSPLSGERETYSSALHIFVQIGIRHTDVTFRM